MPRLGELHAVLAVAGALVGWQLFVPPIIGLADQGDFVRVLGPLGYAPQPKGPEHKYSFLTRKYVLDPSYREPRWEQLSSEFVPAALAVILNRSVFSAEQVDLTTIGFVHALFFLIALNRLLSAIRPLPNHRIAWILVLLILTDVGYVAYWNSWYTEPASCIWLLFLLTESIQLCTTHPSATASVGRWSVFAILWIGAKTQNAALAGPLFMYALLLARRAKGTFTRWVATTGALAILATGCVMYRSLLPAPRLVGIYNMIFMAILPESNDPASDLQSLGLDPKYVQYSGTLPWSPHTGVADGYLVNAIQERITPLSIVRFYLTRPHRMWFHIRLVLQTAFSLRPEFCGNYESSAGMPPEAKSHSFAVWSHFHERFLTSIGAFLLVALAIAPLACGIALFGGHDYSQSLRRSLEMAICLSTCCLLAFLSAAFGDDWDNVKHQYVFNLLLDVCIVWATMACFTFVQRRFKQKSSMKLENVVWE